MGISLVFEACLDDSSSVVTISFFRLRHRPIHLFVSWGINLSVTPNRSQCLIMNWSLTQINADVKGGAFGTLVPTGGNNFVDLGL